MKSLLVALTFLVAVGCSSAVVAKTVIGATKTGILIWIAEAQGYFDSVPGGVDIRLYQSGSRATKDLIDGKINLATGSDFAFGSNAMTHGDLRIAGAISSSRTCQLFARSDRGIASVADLAGKRVAVTKKSIGQYFLGQILTLAGIERNVVELVHMSPKDIVKAISSGEVDAGITWEPYVFEAKRNLGDKFATLREERDGRPYYFLLTSQAAWLERHGDAARAVVGALKMAEEFASREPDAAKAIIRERFDLKADYLDNLWPQHTLKVHLPQNLLFVVEEGLRWRQEEGLSKISDIPDVAAWVYMPALEAVSPQDVRIIR